MTMAAIAADLVLFVVTAALFTWHKKASCSAESTTAEKTCDASLLSNSAFVFIKPHANTPATQTLVREKLVASGITILSETEIDGKTIDEKKVRLKKGKKLCSKSTERKSRSVGVSPFFSWHGDCRRMFYFYSSLTSTTMQLPPRPPFFPPRTFPYRPTSF
jgi:hypothetical protein